MKYDYNWLQLSFHLFWSHISRLCVIFYQFFLHHQNPRSTLKAGLGRSNLVSQRARAWNEGSLSDDGKLCCKRYNTFWSGRKKFTSPFEMGVFWILISNWNSKHLKVSNWRKYVKTVEYTCCMFLIFRQNK